VITEWFCFEHEDGDIKKRHHGAYRCSNWKGPDDDTCVILLAQIVEVGDTDLNDIPEPDRTAR
jgi:hypothetical protein